MAFWARNNPLCPYSFIIDEGTVRRYQPEYNIPFEQWDDEAPFCSTQQEKLGSGDVPEGNESDAEEIFYDALEQGASGFEEEGSVSANATHENIAEEFGSALGSGSELKAGETSNLEYMKEEEDISPAMLKRYKKLGMITFTFTPDTFEVEAAKHLARIREVLYGDSDDEENESE